MHSGRLMFKSKQMACTLSSQSQPNNDNEESQDEDHIYKILTLFPPSPPRASPIPCTPPPFSPPFAHYRSSRHYQDGAPPWTSFVPVAKAKDPLATMLAPSLNSYPLSSGSTN